MNNSITPSYRIISWDEFCEHFSTSDNLPFDEYSEDLAEIRLYEPDIHGNIHISGDFFQDSTINTAFHGNLIIDGNLQIDCDDWGNFMCIKGNLEAKSVVACGTLDMIVHGDLKSANGILGCYGSDGGFLTVYGNISSPIILNTLQFNISSLKQIHGVIVDTSYGNLDADFNEDTLTDVLIADVLEEDNDIDIPKIWSALQEGRNIMNSSVVKKT